MTGKAIKALRKKLGDTQQQFADRIGVRRATISDWENDTATPSPMAMERIVMHQDLSRVSYQYKRKKSK